MLNAPFGLDQILAPLGAERFFAEYEDRQPLHLEGTADKFAEVMTWARLDQLLGQASIWSHRSLVLVLDGEPVPANRYCAPALGRDGGQVLRPDPERVQGLLRQGATLVANDIDHLSDGLTAFADAMEQALGGKVQGNLYLSSRQRQGFGAHYDTHDVYAVHVEGTKTWRVYANRAEHPIAHTLFKNFGQAHHERAKGDLLMEVRMSPGDLLYLPRGWYHDALADEGGCVHVAFGITYPIGLDVMSALFERAVAEPVFRANLPRLDGDAAARALKDRLLSMAERLGEILDDEATVAEVTAFQRGFRYPRHHYDLPGLLGGSTEGRFRVRARGMRLVEQGGRFGLVAGGDRAATEVPAELGPLVGWVLERQAFSRSELAEAFPDRPAAQLDRLLSDLGAMRLTEPS